MKIGTTVFLATLLALSMACGGYSSNTATTPATAGTTPTIAELAPDSTNSGGPAFVLTVNGTNFNSNATINWNGTPQTTAYVSASQLTATVADSYIATPGTATVTVTNPGIAGGRYGGGTLQETSNSMTFTIN